MSLPQGSAGAQSSSDFDSIRDMLSAVSCGHYAEASARLAEMREGRDPTVSIARWGSFLDLVLKYLLPAERSLRSANQPKKGVLADLKARYDTIIEKFQFCAAMAGTRRVMTSDKTKHVDHACAQMVVLARTRRDLLTIYMRLLSLVQHPGAITATAGAGAAGLASSSAFLGAGTTSADGDEWHAVAETAGLAALLSQFEANVSHVSVGRMRDLVIAEINTLDALLHAQAALGRYNFKDTIIWLSKSKRNLADFHGATTGSALLSGLSRRKSDRDANTDCCKTYLLLHNVLTLLSRKATLYFNRILEGPAAGGGGGGDKPGAKEPIGQQNRALINRLCDFHRKAGASFVSIHYTVDKNPGPDQRFHIDGYQHPDVPYDTPTGLRGFPALFGFPEPAVPLATTATIFAIAAENEAQLRAFEVVCIDEGEYKSKADREKFAYYLVKTDRQVIVTVVHQLHGKRKQELATGNETKAFLASLSRTLRNVWLSAPS